VANIFTIVNVDSQTLAFRPNNKEQNGSFPVTVFRNTVSDFHCDIKIIPLVDDVRSI